MKRWLAASNIERFKRMLRDGDLDPGQFETVKRLLAEEEATLAKLDREDTDRRS